MRSNAYKAGLLTALAVRSETPLFACTNRKLSEKTALFLLVRNLRCTETVTNCEFSVNPDVRKLPDSTDFPLILQINTGQQISGLPQLFTLVSLLSALSALLSFSIHKKDRL